MVSVSDDPLFQALRDGGILNNADVDAVLVAFLEAAADPSLLAEKLQPLGILTRYQYKKIQVGRAFELIFGDYFLVNKIGEGGMGKVYLAIQVRLGRRVALKVVRPQLLKNKTVMKRYEREARAAQTLDHPNIVKLIDAGEVGGKYFLAMEFVDGLDLSRLVKEHGPLPYPEACEYIRQAALGLSHAHSLRFVHRDIKPSNLLVHGTRASVGTGWGAHVKILDMGLVRMLEDEDLPGSTELTRAGTVVGTPDFMAPEQAKNSSEVDYRADLYALGCTLYYLIRGQVPFPKGNPIDKLISHQIGPVPDIRADRNDLPPMLGDVVARLMRKSPEQRYQTASEVAAALAPFTPEALTLGLSAAPGGTNLAGFSFEPVNPAHLLVTDPSPGNTVTPRPVGTPAPVGPGPHAAPSKPSVSGTEAAPTGPGDSVTPSARQSSAQSKPGPLDENESPSPAKKSSRKSEPDASNGSPLRPRASANGTRRSDPGEKGWSTRRANTAAAWRTKYVYIAASSAAALLVVGLVIASARIVRSKSADSSSIIPKVELPQNRRSIAELLPDDTAAVLVFSPKAYFDRAKTRPPRLNQYVEWFNLRYRFDVRKFERGLIAFPADSEMPVAVGEGPFLTPEFVGGFDQNKTKNYSNGSTTVQFWNDKNVDRKHALLLPKPEAFLLSQNQTALDAITKRALTDRSGPAKLPAGLLDACQHSDAYSLTFVAAGLWELPARQFRKQDTLSSFGVDLLLIRLKILDKAVQVEFTLEGKDQDLLVGFIRGASIKSDHAEMKSLFAALGDKPTVAPYLNRFRLSSSTNLDWESFLATIGYFLTPDEPLMPSVKREDVEFWPFRPTK